MTTLITTQTIVSEIDKTVLGRIEFFKNDRSKFIIKGFSGKRSKADFFFRYSTLKEMMKKVEGYTNNLRHWYKRKIEQRDKQKINTKEFKDKLKVGAILCDSWGYDQTNVEFYIVLEVNKTKSKIKIQELSHLQQTDEGMSSMACNVTPDIGRPHGDILEKQVRSDYINICSSIHLSLWDGSPKYKSWYA